MLNDATFIHVSLSLYEYVQFWNIQYTVIKCLSNIPLAKPRQCTPMQLTVCIYPKWITLRAFTDWQDFIYKHSQCFCRRKRSQIEKKKKMAQKNHPTTKYMCNAIITLQTDKCKCYSKNFTATFLVAFCYMFASHIFAKRMDVLCASGSRFGHNIFSVVVSVQKFK